MKNEQWKKNPTRFIAMTGITIEAFETLLPYFEDSHDFYFNHYNIHGKAVLRQRSYTIYKNSPLASVSERLVFILSYLKLNPIQEQHADLFDMTQKQCNEFLHATLRILEMSLKDSECLPARTEKELLQRLNEIPAELCSEKRLLHDGTEREVPRPADYDEQQEFYSGKKKAYREKCSDYKHVVPCAFHRGNGSWKDA
ncbi:MAG: transposase family protein [Carboxylicivirga sp.]|jgi:hypothetical protein|nr:transposase family protein [Carboxylicivirga sp.]